MTNRLCFKVQSLGIYVICLFVVAVFGDCGFTTLVAFKVIVCIVAGVEEVWVKWSNVTLQHY